MLLQPWYLYLIECADGSIYTGITVDVEARYTAHLNGAGARYTRSHPPARLLGSVKGRVSGQATVANRETAIRRQPDALRSFAVEPMAVRRI